MRVHSESEILMKIYVCSRASIPERVEMWKQARADGAHIVSTWIDEAGQGKSNMKDLWKRIVTEILSCDRLIVYVEKNDLPVRGVFVEAGIGLAFGKQIIVCCPDMSLFEIRKNIGSWTVHENVKIIPSLFNALMDPL